MKDRITGRPRGFGFVTFEDPSACDKVVEDKHVIGGRTVEAKKSVPQDAAAARGPRTKKIFVGGLAASTTEEEFTAYFSTFGNVVDHQIMMDHSTGRSRGFGFITFDTEQSVENVLAHGRMHQLGSKQVEVKKAEPRKVDGPGSGSGYGGDSYGRGYSGSYGPPRSYGDPSRAGFRGSYTYGPAYPGSYAGVPYGPGIYVGGGFRSYPGYTDAYAGAGRAAYPVGPPFPGVMGGPYLPPGVMPYGEGQEGYTAPVFSGGYPQAQGGTPIEYSNAPPYSGITYAAYPPGAYHQPPASPALEGYEGDRTGAYPVVNRFQPYRG
eukprot:TRINITY_DN5010_c0_g1_i1.p1 TRINITY_DN5010_c0_g1~~TRINITY_DN5010_c0_g1_i1.p1  ORF type:complete len:321 (-),score=17.84 TRINITY_DN5010_c0_g1_i1:593-1555(-)